MENYPKNAYVIYVTKSMHLKSETTVQPEFTKRSLLVPGKQISM